MYSLPGKPVKKKKIRVELRRKSQDPTTQRCYGGQTGKEAESSERSKLSVFTVDLQSLFQLLS